MAMIENCMKSKEESIEDIDPWEEPPEKKNGFHSMLQASHLIL